MIQTLAYEGIGLALAVPIYATAFGSGASESAALLGLMVLIVLVWAPLHNTAFDWVDWHFTGRSACARPHCLRLVHAFSTRSVAWSSPCPSSSGWAGCRCARR